MKGKQKSLINGFLAFLLVIATFLPSFSNVAYAEEQGLKNGTYELSFQVHKDGTNEKSVMDDYTKKPAVLTVQDGSLSIDMTLTNSNWYEDFTVEGSRPEVIEERPEANERVVRFPISSLEEKVDAWVHIIVTGIPGFSYDNQYDVQIALDQSTLTPLQVEEEPVTEEPGTEEPGTEEPGTEEPGTEEPGTEEPGTEEPGTEEPGTEEPGTEEPGTEEPVVLEDGAYSIPISAKHATEDRQSSMINYLVNPTEVVVENGQANVTLTAKQSHLITDLQLESNGEFRSGEVTNEDTANQTRTYSFQLAELYSELAAKVSMSVPMGNGQVYENTQNFRLILDLEEAEKQPEEPVIEEPVVLEEGTYSLPFSAKHATEDQPSSMGGYLTNPTSLVVENGVSALRLITKDSHQVTDVQLLVDGEYQSGDVVENNTTEQTRTTSYSFNELTRIVPAKVSMRVPLGNGQFYENTREFRLILDLDGAELIETETPTPEPETPDTDEIVNGQYEVDFSVLKNGTEDISVMDEYTEKPASLFVKDGEYTVEMTLTNSHWYKGLTINGEQPVTVSENAEENKRVVQFPINSLENKIDAWVHIVVTGIPGFEYDNQYDVQIQMDWAGMKLVEEGNEPTPEPPGTDQPDPDPTPNPTPTPEPNPTPDPGDEELENGQYDIDFSVLKDGTNEISVMDQYTEKPATVYVKDGTYTVDLTLTNSSWYKDLTIASNKPAVVSEDKANDKKIVRYETDSLVEAVDASVHIVVEGIPGFSYDNHYDVQIALDAESLELVKKEVQPPTPVTSAQPGGGQEPPKVQPEPKPENNNQDQDELVDGRYEIDFSVLKNGTEEISVMDQYTEKPATVYVKDNTFTVDLTLTNSQWYEDLTIQNQRPDIISEDAAADKRVVRFETDHLSDKVDAWVHIIVPAIQYDNKYDVQIALDADSLTLIEKDGTLPTPIDTVKPPSDSGTKVEPTPLTYDRNDVPEPTNASKQKVVNAKTSENSLVGLYVSLLVLSMGYFTWRYVARKRVTQS